MMKGKLVEWWNGEVLVHRKVYVLLAVIMVVVFFVRVYRLGELLGFYYDQGRDALIIWDLWHKGRWFLIGPTTGIEGIFLGPLYYYLIAPFYALSGGDPVSPAIFLAILTTFTSYLLFWLGKRYFSYGAGVLAAVIFGLSYYILLASRWLSNPTPLLFASVVMICGLAQVLEGKKWGWVLAVGAASAGLQFEAASETFFLPAMVLFLVWQRKILSWRIVLLSLVVFGGLLMPQVIFNWRHDGVLVAAFRKFLVQDKSFRSTGVFDLIGQRVSLYYQVFGTKLLPNSLHLVKWWLVVSLVGLWGIKKVRRTKEFLATLWLFLLTPLVFMVFYQGNNGYIWDYYFTGVLPIFVLLFAVGLSGWGRRWWGWVLPIAFLLFFLKENGVLTRYYLIAVVDGPEHVTLGNMKQAVDWVFNDADGEKFSVDTYVPPVIPYSFDYLYLWMGTGKYGLLPEKERVSLLYTIYEVDPPHPERLEAWLVRQAGIGKVEKTVKFGGVTAEKRVRVGDKSD